MEEDQSPSIDERVGTEAALDISIDWPRDGVCTS
jgi:hypothetical protein